MSLTPLAGLQIRLEFFLKRLASALKNLILSKVRLNLPHDCQSFSQRPDGDSAIRARAGADQNRRRTGCRLREWFDCHAETPRIDARARPLVDFIRSRTS